MTILPVGMTSTSMTWRRRAHDGAFAVILGDLLDRQVEILVPRGAKFTGFGGCFFGFGGHGESGVRGKGATLAWGAALARMFWG